MLQSIKILGVSVTNEKADKILEYVVSRVKNGNKKLFIVTPNPEILAYAQAHPDYKAKLNHAEVALPDGIGLLIAGQILSTPLKERITGVDFIEMVCKTTRENPMSIGFLGGRGGVAEEAVKRLKKKYPWIQVVFVGEEWDKEGFNRGPVNSSFPQVLDLNEASFNDLRASGNPSAVATPPKNKQIDILFVAFGFPKQEEWIYENLPKLPVKAAVGVGGAFDYLSGKVPRAPKFVQAIGLEWVFRLFIQPWRWKRQLALFTFIYLILKKRVQRR